MKQSTISLNGKWLVDYLSREPYESTVMPDFIIPDTPNKEQRVSSVTEVRVPGYFEDMIDLYRKTPIYSKLAWNPTYTQHRYPQGGYCPDLTLPNPVGCFVYKKSFTVDKLIDSAAALFCGGVQNRLSAWVNGTYLGTHEGYSVEFTMEIPSGALREGENCVTLAVSNNRLAGYKGRPVSGLTSRAANECTGGIWGDVEIRFYHDGLRDAWVRVSEDVGAFTLYTDGGEEHERRVEIYDGKKKVADRVIAPGERSITLSSDGYETWSPDNPKLYRFKVTCGMTVMEGRFGVRRLTADGIRLKLNSKPYYFRGTCEHCYHPITVHPTRDKEYYRRVIRILKELGFNSVRFHTYVPMPEYMEAADELGMVFEIETPNNTTYAEWLEIVNKCRHYTCVCAFSSGNEMMIDEDYIEHLNRVADYVHSQSDGLFSPMSAMRGIEYFDYGPDPVDEPFLHNKRRLDMLGKFSDVYNSYSLAATSYESADGDHEILDQRQTVYKKPILSHEICIHGTYIDLSLKDRYIGSRIGDTEFMSSVESHLAEVGILDRANLYYRNSVKWQMMLRKHCFETVRRTDTFAGYDFLGDIDTHWHTFGYCVGMMNEFYELKAGESVENVLKYNGDTVLLCDFPRNRSYFAGENITLPILVSNYGEHLDRATLRITVKDSGKVLVRREIRLSDIRCGAITELYRLSLRLPTVKKPTRITVDTALWGGNTDASNDWDIYVFPRVKSRKVSGVSLVSDISRDELIDRMNSGERVVLMGTGPFASVKTSFQLSVAGRTNGHLATVIADHPLVNDIPNDGYCGWQFRDMLDSRAALLDIRRIPHRPIVDIASSYKNAHREAMLFEYGVGEGKLLVCTLNLDSSDPGALWLSERIKEYAMSDAFDPRDTITAAELYDLCSAESVKDGKNENAAQNKNDITM